MDELIITTPGRFKQIVNSCLTDFLDKYTKKSTSEPSDEFLKSIKEIASFLGCSSTTAQKIKNQYKHIFMQLGRKFLVRKTDLIEALKMKL
jgi:hypothetical protein